MSVHLTDKAHYGAALLFATGSQTHLEVLQAVARERGMTLTAGCVNLCFRFGGDRLAPALQAVLVTPHPAARSSGLRSYSVTPSSTRPLSLPSGQGDQRSRISAVPQWRACFARRGGIARFANAEAVGKSRFVLGGSVESGRGFHVSPDSTTECSGGDSKPQRSKPYACQRARWRGYCR